MNDKPVKSTGPRNDGISTDHDAKHFETAIETDVQSADAGTDSPARAITTRNAQDTAAQDAVTRAQELPVKEIAGYRIDGILGRGGMGVVYAATDQKLNRRVALKTLAFDRQHITMVGQRLHQEAQILAQVRHPNVAQVFDAGTHDGTPWLTMELIEGPTLSAHCRNQPLTAKAACQIAIAVAEAIAACHKSDVVHRDLKPSNILLADGVTPKVTDFGIAKFRRQDNQITRTGDVMGTPSYMAPEQASGVVRNIGPKTDVYGLGAILYEMLTGRPPFMGPEPMQTLMMVLTNDPAPPRSIQPQVPKDLETICLKCLEKKPSARYESAVALADDLKRFQRGEPIAARPPSSVERLQKWVRRRPAIASIIGLVALGIVGAITGLWMHNNALQATTDELQVELDRSQRIVAESRRLSEWLLFDFSEQLTTNAGPTANRKVLASRIHNHLSALTAEAEFDDDLKVDVAKSLIQLAQIQGDPDQMNLGQMDEAKKTLAEADSLLDSLNDSAAVADRVQRIRGMLLLSRARILQEQNEFDAAKTLIDEAEPLILARELHSDGQAYSATLRLREVQYGIEFQLGNLAAAQQTLNEMTEIAEDDSPLISISERTQFQCRLAVYRAHLLERERRLSDAIPNLEATLEKAMPVYEQHADNSFHGIIALLANQLGDAEFSNRDFAAALAHYQTSLSARRRLLDGDPDNALLKHNMGVTQSSIADTLVQLGDVASALEALDEAEKHYRAISDDPESELQVRLALGFVAGSRSVAFQAVGDFENAETAALEKLRLLTTDGDRSQSQRRSIGEAKISLGGIYAMMVLRESEPEGAEFPSALFDRMAQTLEEAIAEFDSLEKDGLLSGVEDSQRQNAISMLQQMQDYRKQMTAPDAPI